LFSSDQAYIDELADKGIAFANSLEGLRNLIQ